MKPQQLLVPRFLLPIRPAATVLEDHAVALEGDRIVAIGPLNKLKQQFPAAEQTHLPDHVLMPGLINMHTHSPMSLLRGYADDVSLDTWLRDHIWPAEAKWVSAEFVRDGTQLAMAEMLRAGITTFNEMYFFPEVIADSARRAGMRAWVGMPVIDVNTPWAGGIQECLEKAADFQSRCVGEDLVNAVFAPHASYTVDDAGLSRVADLSQQWQVPVCMHVLEISWEIKHAQQTFKKSLLQRLYDLELLNERFLAVHAVHVDRNDIELLAHTGVQVIHCPESNLKLASGISPVMQMIEAGINVSVGTDGAASNNNLDLLGEVRTAALLAKGAGGDACALNAWQALDLVTINGARALGVESDLGTIEVGKLADLCAIDLSWPETQPLHHIHSQLVYSASSRQVSDVWVAGRRLLDKGELTSIELSEVLRNAENWKKNLSGAIS